MDIPADLCCPLCSTIFKNAVQLPCCFVTACRSCAFKKLLGSDRKCWVASSSTCSQSIQLDQLVPAADLRQKVEDFLNEGKKLDKDSQNSGKGDDAQNNKAKKINRRDPRLRGKLVLCEKIDDEPENEDQENNESENQEQGKANSETPQTSSETLQIKQEIIEPIVKQEPIDPAETFDPFPSSSEDITKSKYREYSESSDLIEPILGPLQSVKTEIKTEQVDDFEESAVWNPFDAANVVADTGGACSCLLCGNPGHELVSCPLIKCKSCGQNGHATFNCPADRQSLDSEIPFNLQSPKKEPMDDAGSVGSTSRNDSAPATASDSSVEQPSSGYWSGPGREPACFGKLRWFSEDKTKGVIECFQDGETKTCFVSGYDVKCGAENGDLVEFVLGQDSQYGKAAKKVKLVEKGLPDTEHERIRRQDSLKRSLEISSGMADGEGKKLKPDDIIDVKMEMASENSWSDIAEDDDGKDGSSAMQATLRDDPVSVKAERMEGVAKDVEGCICDKGKLVQCGVCPFYYLEASQDYGLEQDESATIVAKLYAEKNEVKEGLKFVRQLKFPFSCPKGSEFEAIQNLGDESLVQKVSPVFCQDYVFVTLVNNSESEDPIDIKRGDILGICQEHKIKKSQISPHFMFEPPDRQRCQDLPVVIKKGDLGPDDRNVMCGFGVMGEEDMNYKNCLVRVELVPRMARHFSLARDLLTVQLNRNLWLEIRAKGNRNVDDYIPANGVIGYAGSVMKESYIRDLFCHLEIDQTEGNLNDESNELIRNNRESQDDFELEIKEEDDNKDDIKTEELDEAAAYDDMLAKIDVDMMTNKVEAKKELPVFDPSEIFAKKTFKAIVNEDVLRIPPNGSVFTVLRIQEELNFKIVPNTKAKAMIRNNEEFKYYNNCYNIQEQLVPIHFEKCKFSRKSLPCVKICIKNPRTEAAFLPRLSPIALVKLQTGSGGKSRPKEEPEPVTVPEAPVPVASPVPPPPPRRRKYSPLKTMHATQKKYIRKWTALLQQNTFQKSLLVEQKYPYFRPDKKPKIPYGLKDLSELNMRVGLDQNCKPVKVLEKVNGVFTCTICDQVILCKFSLQDHWYGKKHKQNMRMVQVIAGMPERLFMNRPVVKELLDQFVSCPLLGLDHVFEVLRGDLEPVYHCSLCIKDTRMEDLIEHLTSTEHIIKFLKDYFPAAWEKFAHRPEPANWTEQDVANFNAIVVKIEAVHGRKNPSVVENSKRLEEAVEKIPLDSYQTKRAELDMFFKSIKTTEEAPDVEEILEEGSIQSRIAILAETIHIPPNTAKLGLLKILNGSAGHLLAGRLVKACKNPAKIGECNVRPGASRVWLESSIAFIQATLHNPMVSNSITVKKNTDLVIVKWRT